MKELLFAQDFAAVLAGVIDARPDRAALDAAGVSEDDGAALLFHVEAIESDVNFQRPLAGVAVKCRPLDASGAHFAYLLTVTTFTDSDERDAANVRCATVKHRLRVDAMREAVFGADGDAFGDASAAVHAAVLGRGNFELLGYDAGTSEVEPLVSNTAFETAVFVSGVAKCV